MKTEQKAKYKYEYVYYHCSTRFQINEMIKVCNVSLLGKNFFPFLFYRLSHKANVSRVGYPVVHALHCERHLFLSIPLPLKLEIDLEHL